MTNGHASTFDVAEDHLHKRLGVARSWIRENRGQEGRWWVRTPAGIKWSAAGVDALTALLRENGGPSEATPPIELMDTLVVWRSHLPNRRVVLAHREDEQAGLVTVQSALTVWVGDSRHFQPGMRLLARLRSGQCFDFVGNPENPAAGRRLPRRLGRW